MAGIFLVFMTIPANSLNIWGGGQLLAYSGIDGTTDYNCGLVARTAFDGTAMEIKAPGNCLLKFSSQLPEKTMLAGDFFDLQVPTGRVRGVFLDAFHLLLEGPVDVLSSDKNIASLSRSNGRTLIGERQHFQADKIQTNLETAMSQRRGWLNSAVQSLPGSHPPATLIKALSVLKTQVYKPEGRINHRWTTPDRWPHRGMWLWDSVFHAIGWRHIDHELARDMLAAVLDVQRLDGFIPCRSDPYSAVDAVTQPPVLALGIKLVNELKPQREWIEYVYPRLKAYLEWDLANRDRNKNGLLEWMIEQHENCRSGESGMDNSPRFDVSLNLDAVDFSAFMARECEIMAEFARLLKRNDEEEQWRSTHGKLCGLMNTFFWNEAEGFYVDYDPDRRTQSSVLASSGFLPLICGAASQKQAQRLVAHLADPLMFGTPLPVPSIAAKDEEHYSKDMWRGPVWINLNWLIAFGCDRYGFKDAADEIRAKTRKEIEKYYNLYGALFEFYDDRRQAPPPQLLRKGRCAPEVSPYHHVVHDYGWTAALYTDLAIKQA